MNNFDFCLNSNLQNVVCITFKQLIFLKASQKQPTQIQLGQRIAYWHGDLKAISTDWEKNGLKFSTCQG